MRSRVPAEEEQHLIFDDSDACEEPVRQGAVTGERFTAAAARSSVWGACINATCAPSPPSCHLTHAEQQIEDYKSCYTSQFYEYDYHVQDEWVSAWHSRKMGKGGGV